MKTNLVGNSNAVLVDNEGNVMSVIRCLAGQNKDITVKIENAIKEHYCSETVSLIDDTDVLTNQSELSFKVNSFEDGDIIPRDFSILIVATY